METSNQTDSPAPYDDPQEAEYEEPAASAEEAAQEWTPKPPTTRVSTGPVPVEEDIDYLEEEQQPAPVPVPTPKPRQPTAGLEGAPRPSGPTASSLRRPILGEQHEKAEQLGIPPRTTSYMVAGVSHGNKRRSTSLLKLLSLVFVINLLVVAAFGAWLYNYFVSQVETRIAEFSSRPAPAATSAAPGSPISSGGATDAELKQMQDDFEKRSADLKAQLQAAQSRLTEAESVQQQQQARIAALASQMANATPGAPDPGTNQETVANAIVPGSAVDSALSLSQSEMILLKERNKLTSYADEAISTGARKPYERLWEALEDERLVKLIHAARAEILRVQNFYLTGSRIESYSIQVGDYFPESAALKDSQLKDDQLIELLSNKKHPWQVRMKAANLLGTRRSKSIGDALVKTVKQDDNLDVVKEATFSFEQMTGFRARLFEPTSMDAWWTQYNAVPTGLPKKATAKNGAPAPPPGPAELPLPTREKQPELRLPEWDDEKDVREAVEKKKAADKSAGDKKVEEKKKEEN